MADGDPMHVYPMPDGDGTASSGSLPAPENDPGADPGSIDLTSPAVSGGTDQPSI